MESQKCSQRGPHFHSTEEYNEEHGIYDYQRRNASFEEQVFYDHLNRLQLANGIPGYAPTCACHQQRLLDEINQGHAITESDGHISFDEVARAHLCNETFTKNSGLLPTCYSCFCSAQSIQYGQKPIPMDMCSCATHIVFASCWYCEANRLEHLKQTAIVQRTIRVDGKETIKCACGDIVKGLEGARRCVGCFGIVTSTMIRANGHPLPVFPTISGPSVRFEPYTAMVKSWVVNPAQPDLLPLVSNDRHQQATSHTANLNPANQQAIQPMDMLGNEQGTFSPNVRRFSNLGLFDSETASNANTTTSMKHCVENASSFQHGNPQTREAFVATERPKRVPMFTNEELRGIQDLYLVCELRSYVVAIPLRSLKRAQVVLDQNIQTRISSSTLVKLFQICGVQKKEFGVVMVEVNKVKTSGFPSGGDVSKAISLKLHGVVE